MHLLTTSLDLEQPIHHQSALPNICSWESESSPTQLPLGRYSLDDATNSHFHHFHRTRSFLLKEGPRSRTPQLPILSRLSKPSLFSTLLYPLFLYVSSSLYHPFHHLRPAFWQLSARFTSLLPQGYPASLTSSLTPRSLQSDSSSANIQISNWE